MRAYLFLTTLLVINTHGFSQLLQDWENGIESWVVEEGLWEVGIPTVGPEGAFSGQQCAGTNLNGNYGNGDFSRLVSPIFVVPESEEFPRLRFWQWISSFGGDYGEVQVRRREEDWETVSVRYDGVGGNVWGKSLVDLGSYGGDSIQVGFLFSSDNISTSTGWYLDSITIETGPYEFNNPEDWENGIGDWSADRGVWEVGIPTVGPEGVFSGQQCAGTNLNGNYGNGDFSRLVSPPVLLSEETCSFQFQFFQWYSTFGGDFGLVQIKTLHGDWENLEGPYSGSSDGWIKDTIDLTAYQDSIIQIGFLFSSDNISTSSGWYIDSLVFPTDLTPRILPDSGHNVGKLATQVFGGGFNEETKVRLEKNGEPAISVPDSLIEYVDCVRLRPTFSLQSVSPGLWDVVAFNESEILFTIPDGFRILTPAIYANSPTKGANIANVTLKLEGAGFMEDMEVKLSKGQIELNAISYISSGPTESFATFNLVEVETGMYDLSFSRKDGFAYTLENAFEVIEGKGILGPNQLGNVGESCPIPTFNLDHFLEWNLIAPPETRPDRVITIEVNFQNTGPIDIPAPKRIFVSEGGAPIGFSEQELAEEKTQLVLEFREANGPPEVLRAGAKGSITVYAKASAPLIHNIIE